MSNRKTSYKKLSQQYAIILSKIAGVAAWDISWLELSYEQRAEICALLDIVEEDLNVDDIDPEFSLKTLDDQKNQVIKEFREALNYTMQALSYKLSEFQRNLDNQEMTLTVDMPTYQMMWNAEKKATKLLKQTDERDIFTLDPDQEYIEQTLYESKDPEKVRDLVDLLSKRLLDEKDKNRCHVLDNKKLTRYLETIMSKFDKLQPVNPLKTNGK